MDAPPCTTDRRYLAETAVACLLVVFLVTNAAALAGNRFGVTRHALALGVPAVAAIVLLVARRPARRPLGALVAAGRRSPAVQVLGLLALYGLALAASALVADDPGAALRGSLGWLEVVGAAAVLAFALRTTGSVRIAVLATVTTTLVITAATVIQHATGTYGFEWGGLAAVDSGFVGQTYRLVAAGPVLESNKFGQSLVALLPLALVHVRRGERTTVRVGAVLTTGLCVLSILYTQSRGALLGLAAVLGVLGWRHLRRSVFAASVAAIGVALAVAPSSWVDQIGRIGEVRALFGMEVPGDGSAAGRASAFFVGLRVFARWPLFGVGSGNFASHYRPIADDLGIDTSGLSRTTHNAVLEVLAETGVIGGVVVAAAVVALYRVVRRAPAARLRTGSSAADVAYTRLLREACAVGLVGYGVCALFLDTFRFGILFVVVVLAVTVATRGAAAPANDRARAPAGAGPERGDPQASASAYSSS